MSPRSARSGYPSVIAGSGAGTGHVRVHVRSTCSVTTVTKPQRASRLYPGKAVTHAARTEGYTCVGTSDARVWKRLAMGGQCTMHMRTPHFSLYFPVRVPASAPGRPRGSGFRAEQPEPRPSLFRVAVGAIPRGGIRYRYRTEKIVADFHGARCPRFAIIRRAPSAYCLVPGNHETCRIRRLIVGIRTAEQVVVDLERTLRGFLRGEARFARRDHRTVCE